MPTLKQPCYHQKLGLALIILLLVGCSKSEVDHTQSSSTQADTALATDTLVSTSDNQIDKSVINQQDNNPTLQNKQLIVNGAVSFDVKNVQQSVQQINQITTQLGGYVAQNTISNNIVDTQSLNIGNQQRKEIISYQRNAQLTVRIPKQNVETFLTQLQQQIQFLHQNEFSAKDVTLDIQKQALLAEIQRQTAQNIASSPTNQDTAIIGEQAKALARTQALYHEIEQKSIADAVALSTISLHFSQPIQLHETISDDIQAKITQQKTFNFIPRFQENLKNGWTYFVEFVLWLAQFWVFLTVIVSIIFGIRQLKIKLKKRPKS